MLNTLVNVPIESLTDRYSASWNEPAHFTSELERYLPNTVTAIYNVYPELTLESTVTQGQFLNVIETNLFKTEQLSRILGMLRSGVIDDNTVLFFHDLWFPGIEQLFYIRDALGLKFKITGMLHAGTYDQHDFLTQQGMSRWAAPIEHAWFNEVDRIFVATHFHANLLIRQREVDPERVCVTGFPLWHEDIDGLRTTAPKENIIVFPHRLAREKNAEAFLSLAERLEDRLPGWQAVRTMDVCKSKQDYHSLLAKSRIAVSLSLQETWGIAQQEALFAGCYPVVPDHLSYSEMYLVGKYPAHWVKDGVEVSRLVDFIVEVVDSLDSRVQDPRYLLTTSQLQADCASAVLRISSELVDLC